VTLTHLSEVLQYTDNDDSQRMQKIKDEIVEISKKLSNVQELNSLLLRQSLAYVSRVLGLLSGKKNITYGKSGYVQGNHNKRLLDQSV
jgi:flagellar biosynthesis/type III secretory pathway chaperone